MPSHEPQPAVRQHLPPRWLAALSIAVGITYGALVWMSFSGQEPGAIPAPRAAGFLAIALVLCVGYVAAPLLAGRGPWSSLGAGLLLAPAALGWLLMFGPGLGRDLAMTAVAVPGLLAIVGLYWVVLSHFWGEFFGNVRRERS